MFCDVCFRVTVMPLTNREKQARKRKRLQKNKELYKAYLQKDRERKKIARTKARNDLNPTEWQAYRHTENNRIKTYRHSVPTDHEPDNPNNQEAYGSRQSFGKALKRVRSSLPSSPRKRKAVTVALANEVGINILKPKHPSDGASLTTETLKKVMGFYTRDDITWQAPGRKDRTIIREKDITGKKIKSTVQTRYMV